jgi:hypothetical protein
LVATWLRIELTRRGFSASVPNVWNELPEKNSFLQQPSAFQENFKKLTFAVCFTNDCRRKRLGIHVTYGAVEMLAPLIYLMK